MDYVRISQQLANRNVDSEDLERQVSQCSGLVKMMCGEARKNIRELAEMREDARKDREEIKRQIKRLG